MLAMKAAATLPMTHYKHKGGGGG